jgi:hypothetical protein
MQPMSEPGAFRSSHPNGRACASARCRVTFRAMGVQRVGRPGDHIELAEGWTQRVGVARSGHRGGESRPARPAGSIRILRFAALWRAR